MKKIRIGIFGLNRGYYNVENILACAGEIVALCDKDEKMLEGFEELIGSRPPFFKDFDEFIKVPMDCVFLANYFHEHTPYAIKCLERGIHVLSETTSNSTMAEGVELVRAVEKSKARYFFAENYNFMNPIREMKKIYESGSLGKLMFAEGEYNHPGSPYFTGRKTPGQKYTIGLHDSDKHWRYFCPATYYITHSLAPLMYATGAFPKKVTAMAVFRPSPKDCDCAKRTGDKAAIIMTQNHDGSVYRITGCSAFGGAENSYRLCGTKGQIENLRYDEEKVMLRYNPWDKPDGLSETNCYYPVPDDSPEDLEYIKKARHGGSDYIVIREIFKAIRENTPYMLDVYFATTMASVAILGHRSILYGGVPYDIPDFRLESDKKKWEKDRQSPFHYSDGTEPNIPCCSHPDYKPSQTQLDNAVKWINKLKNGEFDDVERLK